MTTLLLTALMIALAVALVLIFWRAVLLFVIAVPILLLAGLGKVLGVDGKGYNEVTK
jgi:hypothetical protein